MMKTKATLPSTTDALAALAAQSLPLNHGYNFSDKNELKAFHESLASQHSQSEIEITRQNLVKVTEEGIQLLSVFEENYPALLRRIFSPPILLYLQGNTKLIEHASCVAIVGSRNADVKGCAFAGKFARELASQGACIVSGLALGIDGAAHRGAIEGTRGDSTIAVLGNGLPDVYPASHKALAQQILSQHGLLVSPFPPRSRPLRHHFLYRNQIIAGLAHGGIIIQAGKRSGSLSTARHLLENGREVFVIPGEIDDARYEGSLSLIQQGASIARCSSDVTEQLSDVFTRTISENCSGTDDLTITQQSLRDFLLMHGPAPLSMLEAKLAIQNVALEICQLELRGFVRLESGNIVTWTD